MLYVVRHVHNTANAALATLFNSILTITGCSQCAPAQYGRTGFDATHVICYAVKCYSACSACCAQPADWSARSKWSCYHASGVLDTVKHVLNLASMQKMGWDAKYVGLDATR